MRALGSREIDLVWRSYPLRMKLPSSPLLASTGMLFALVQFTHPSSRSLTPCPNECKEIDFGAKRFKSHYIRAGGEKEVGDCRSLMIDGRQ